MNLSLVRYFLAVVETGGFTRGAERAHVTQPTLSAGIKRLEADLGAALFDRGRGATLTAAGNRFLPHARLLLQEWTAARRDLRQPRSLKRRLRLGALSGLLSSPFPTMLGGFLGQHPDIAIEMVEGPAAWLDRRLALGRIDMALTLLPEAGDEAHNLGLYRQRYALAVPARHGLATRASVRVAELNDQPFVIRPQAESLEEAERLFDRLGAKPRIVGRAETDAALLALVRAGLGLAVMPQRTIEQAEGVALVNLPDWKLVHRIGLIWRPAQDETAEAVTALVGFASSHDWDAGQTAGVIGH